MHRFRKPFVKSIAKVLMPLIVLSLIITMFQTQAQIISSGDYLSRQWSAYENRIIENVNIPALAPAVIYEKTDSNYTLHSSWLGRKLWSEHLIQLDSAAFSVYIDPVVDFRLGYEANGNGSIYQNTRGFLMNGRIGKHLFFRSEFYETQATFPQYIQAWVDSFQIIPGMIHVKNIAGGGFDWGTAYGQLIWQPYKNYSVRFGQDKFHLGNGYRSLTLNETSQPYTFLMNNWHKGPFSWTNILALLNNTNIGGFSNAPRASTGEWQKKMISVNYLSIAPTPKITIGFTEAVVFKSFDSTGFKLNPLAIDPIPFTRAAFLGMNSVDNVLLALDVSWNISHSIRWYFQTAYDGKYKTGTDTTKQHRFGILSGIKVFEPFHIKRLFLLAEYSHVKAGTFQHNSPGQSYFHHNQALGHPLGSDFSEIILMAAWSPRRFNLRAQIHIITTGLSNQAAVSTDFWSPEPPFVVYDASSGIKANIYRLSLTASWTINPANKLEIFGGINMRMLRHPLLEAANSSWIQAGIRMPLRNEPFDFF